MSSRRATRDCMCHARPNTLGIRGHPTEAIREHPRPSDRCHPNELCEGIRGQLSELCEGIRGKPSEGRSLGVHGDLQVKSPDILSENEFFDYQLSTTEDSEVEWPFLDNMDRTPDWSEEGSISDEDSLIEISLPGGHYVKHKEDDQPNNYSTIQRKLPDFMPESIFQQRSLMELLAELNDMHEEENLIEIDISMGSIKGSTFQGLRMKLN
ncbi:Nuclear transcription factor Y subunit B-3 [Hibiscus syriacus]|uniref:Nuclear transcription factor Y subunit B-3 n=1 Tax=Hibiscus syriacus TaxID=106335 RepID=A0A6A3AET2_HIBSY|nr:Nuclear transcription factor Y subunit B-3 [Hibiscus syriacus]